MTVIAAYLYRNGERVREVSIEERLPPSSDKSEFVWIGVADPTEDEMATLARTYSLHPLAVEDAINANQLPKVDIYADQLFVVGSLCFNPPVSFLGVNQTTTAGMTLGVRWALL